MDVFPVVPKSFHILVVVWMLRDCIQSQQKHVSEQNNPPQHEVQG